MAAMVTRNTERKRDALIASITVKTMPEMLKRLIPKEKSPDCVGRLYRNAKGKYNKVLNLSEKEKEILSNLGSDGFDKCDTPLLYKLIKYFNFVGAPTKGWGRLNNELQNTGDVIEAIIRLRDEIVENPSEDFQNRVNKMVEIAKVVDKTLSTGHKFENAVKPSAVDDFYERCSVQCTVTVKVTKEEGNLAKYASEDTVLEDEEESSADEDIFTNFLHTKIKISPDFILKAAKHSASKLKQVNELNDKLSKTFGTSSKDISNESLKSKKTKKRKLTVSDAAVDYPSILTIYSCD